MKSRKDAAKHAKKCIGLSNRGLGKQRENSDLCDAFLVGDYMDLKGHKGRPVQFSKPLPYINAVNGYLVQTRRKAKYVAMVESEQEQQAYGSGANAIREYVRSVNRADQVETRQDRQLIVKGIGAVATAMTYDSGFATRDPNGEIIKDEVTDYCGWDPMARKPNLMDRRWDYYRKSYDLEEAKKLFDTSEDENFEEQDNHTDDDEFAFDPTIGPVYDKSKIDYDWNLKDENTVWVYFFEWYEVETYYKAENPVFKIQNDTIKQIAMHRMDAIEADAKTRDENSMFSFDGTAEQLIFDGETKKKLEEEFGEQFKAYPSKRKVFYTAITSGNHCFDVYLSPSQYSFWMGFKTGYWDAKNRIWFGMVNPMMEPTKYSNKALTEMMYLIANTAKGGWFYEKSSIKSRAEFEANVNRTDGNVELTDGGLDKIRKKSEPFNPAGWDQILQAANTAVSDMAVDLSFLGNSDSGNQSAMMFRQRVRQVNAMLACYVDAIESFQEEDARMELDFYKIYAENNDGGMVRIMGKKGAAQFMHISQDTFAPSYDVSIEEAPVTPEEKAEQAQTLITMAQNLVTVNPGAAVACYNGAVDLLGIEEESKQQILQALQPPQPNPEQEAMAQQEQRLQLQAQQSLIEKLAAETQLMQAKIEQIMVQNEKTDAEVGLTAAKSEGEVAKSQQTHLENALLPVKQLADIKVQVTA